MGVAVVFTDLVGSTALAAGLGPVEAERLRLAHFGALRDAVEHHGGREVKNLGDGIMAVFPGASAALEAAVAMQRAIQRHNTVDDAVQIAIRTGVGTGDCIEEDGDYFGEPVVQAARLCARAEGGEILAHAVFCVLIPRDSHELEDLGITTNGTHPLAGFRSASSLTAHSRVGLSVRWRGRPVPGGSSRQTWRRSL